MATNSEVLGRVALFELLDDQERAVLAERLDTCRVPGGQLLFREGDPGGTLYVVIEGSVELFVTSDTGDRIVVERPQPGDFFGEISMLDAGPRTTSALVVNELVALVVDRGDLDEFLRLRPDAALDLLAASGRRLRETATLLRRTASRNVNEEEEDKRTTVMRIADAIAAFSGSITFLMIHVVVFAAWILLNVAPLAGTRYGGFDPFPFGLLTMAVSLEAIILSVFLLLSQSRQAARDHVRNDIEYRVNLKAELEISHLHEKVDAMNIELLARLAQLERAGASKHAPLMIALHYGFVR